MLAPGGDRIGGIEPRRRADRLPEPLEVGLAEDAGRPADVRRGDDRPVDQPLGDEGAVERVQVARLGLADEHGIEVGEELRLGVSGELDQGRLRLAPGADPGELVLGGLVQHVLRPELDRRAAHVRIRVADDDPPRTGLVGLAHDRARRRRVLDLAEDRHLLAGLDVRADPNRELGVPAQPLVGVQERGGVGASSGRA